VNGLIAANIKRRCEAEGIAVSELEKRIGLGNGTIRRWDEMSPRIDKLKAVADYFCVTVDELLNDGADNDK